MTKFTKSALILANIVCMSYASSADKNVSTCQAISNDLARLACYDTLFAGQDIAQLNIPSSPTTPVPLQVVPANKPVESATKDESFGLEQVEASADDNVLSTTVAKIKANPFGIRTLTMSNGHQWRETESSSLRVKVGQQVYIEKGVFSAYYLKVEGSNREMRVKRLK